MKKNKTVSKPDYKTTRLINYPTKVMVGEVESLLLQTTVAAKKRLIFVIFHRLHNRYIRPLRQTPGKKKSGFLTMAAACLMIEAFQSFREGLEYTRDKGAGEKCFRKFFQENKSFNELVPSTNEFYRNIRCGVLHQAETYENWLIIRKRGEPLYNRHKKAINADVFLQELAASLRAYCRSLSKADLNDPLWENAKYKLGKICEHCKGVPKPIWSYSI